MRTLRRRAVVVVVACLVTARAADAATGMSPGAHPSPVPSVPLRALLHAASGLRTVHAQACPPGGQYPGVVYVVFQPGTPAHERAAAHLAAGATPGGEQTFEDGSIAVTVTVPVGREATAMQVYRARPAVRTAMPVAISCPAPRPTESVQLEAGCNNVALTWPTGTPTDLVGAAVSPAGALESIWRLDNAYGHVLGWSPAPNAPNDLGIVNRLDAVFICMRGVGTLARPLL